MSSLPASILAASSGLVSNVVTIADAKEKLKGVKTDADMLQDVVAAGHMDVDREIVEVREEIVAKETALRVLEERMVKELADFKTFAEGEVDRLRRDVLEKDREMKLEVAQNESSWQALKQDCVHQREEFSKSMQDNQGNSELFSKRVRDLKSERENLTFHLRAQVKHLEGEIDLQHSQELKEQNVIHERICSEIERLKTQADRVFQAAEEKWAREAEAIDEFAVGLADLLQRDLSLNR